MYSIIFIVCLSVSFYVYRTYPINTKTAEPIEPKQSRLMAGQNIIISIFYNLKQINNQNRKMKCNI